MHAPPDEPETESENVPWLALFFESPLYVPVIVTGVVEDEGVYVTEHPVPEEIVHVAPGEENAPDPLLENVIVSPTIDPEVPETVAVHAVPLPILSVEGEQLTDTEVDARGTITEMEYVPELWMLSLSPSYVAVIVT